MRKVGIFTGKKCCCDPAGKPTTLRIAKQPDQCDWIGLHYECRPIVAPNKNSCCKDK